MNSTKLQEKTSTTNKSLKDLRNAYFQEIKDLDDKIERYRKRLRRAVKSHNSDEVYTVQKLLSVFYSERIELVERARELKKYCEEE